MAMENYPALSDFKLPLVQGKNYELRLPEKTRERESSSEKF